MIFWLACLQHNELYICYMYSIHLMYIRCIKLICRAKQKHLRFGITLLKKKIYTPQCGLETIFLFLWCYIDRNRNRILGTVIWFFIQWRDLYKCTLLRMWWIRLLESVVILGYLATSMTCVLFSSSKITCWNLSSYFQLIVFK